MVTIMFESHATTLDNESHVASGHFDVELSKLGEKQAKELGERYQNDQFDVIFCSDLQRSYKTAEIAFGNKFPMIKDPRLRECDYGDMTRHPSDEVEMIRSAHIEQPFPEGESYSETTQRMKQFLRDLYTLYDGKRVMIIGHRATQYGLEVGINKKPLEQVVPAAWSWQPGWSYQLIGLV